MEEKPKMVKQVSRSHNPVHSNPQPPVKEHPIIKILDKKITVYLRGEKMQVTGKLSGYKEGLLLITEATTPSGPRSWVYVDRSSVILIEPA